MESNVEKERNSEAQLSSVKTPRIETRCHLCNSAPSDLLQSQNLEKKNQIGDHDIGAIVTRFIAE